MKHECPVCCGADTLNIARFRFENPIFSSCLLFKCQCCEMVFASPMPNERLLFEYNANYFSVAHGGTPNDYVTTAFFSGIARIRKAFVNRFLRKHGISVRKVLEFGPGFGFFASSWLQDEPQTSYFAIETDQSCYQSLHALGVELVTSTSIESVDLVVMSHVLEHVSDPIAFVRQATLALRPGGVLFIEVPCRDFEHKPMDEPHVLFFDKKPMKRLLESLGFSDIEISYHGLAISRLRSQSWLGTKLTAIRSKLLGMGLVALFSRKSTGLECLASPLERAVVAPFLAHRESAEPAWWLRAVARKL